MEAMDGTPPQIPGYAFAQKLGSGSEANVYLYQQLSPSRQVAIKVSKGMLDPRAAARFRSEANFMGKISSHPYILSVYESGVTATGNGYTVFEYAPGGNYKTFLESNRLNADQMLTVGINLASALFTAHREGIIHRDIKPSNILINTHGMPMLSDFGIAGTIYGRPGIGYTIAWAPPEVLAKNGGGNESSDIYSLGATLFAMLTGQSPYEYGYSEALGATRGKNRGALLRNIILTNPLPKLNRPDIPQQVERILRKALNKTPEDRYYSAYDFARDMQRAQQELYGHATPTTVEGGTAVPAEPVHAGADERSGFADCPKAAQHLGQASCDRCFGGRRDCSRRAGVRVCDHAEYGFRLRQQQRADQESGNV